METVKDDPENPRIPVRLYIRKISGGRVKITASIPLGGSWLTYETVFRDVLDGRRAEGYAQFVKDSEEYKAKNKLK